MSNNQTHKTGGPDVIILIPLDAIKRAAEKAALRQATREERQREE